MMSAVVRWVWERFFCFILLLNSFMMLEIGTYESVTTYQSRLSFIPLGERNTALLLVVVPGTASRCTPCATFPAQTGWQSSTAL